MTQTQDPWLVDAMWRAADLTQAYLAQDRAQVAACLAGLGTGRMERVCAWLILDHDQLFEELGEPSMSVREIYVMTALAPLDTEVAVATAVQRVTAGETGIAKAVDDLALGPRAPAFVRTVPERLPRRYREGTRQMTAQEPRMSQQPAPAPDRQPLDEQAAASVLAYAADQRAKVDVLASVLEDIAANGYPSPESGVLWEDARDAHLERLAGEQPRVA